MRETPCPVNVRSRRFSVLAVISVAVISVIAYHSMLGYFFTGTDTLTLIETSRINSLGDLVKLFTKPLMDGSKFVDIAKFFRPVASLSYAMDYHVWGLNPFGFQLTNLLLNVLAACLVVIVMYRLSSGDTLFAWLSGMIFAFHPILVESVPATDRRHDIIAAIFMLASIWFFLRNSSEGPRSKWLKFWSLTFYMMALGAKEIAIILPVWLFVQKYFDSNSNPRPQRILESLRACAPYMVLTLAYLIWRTIILGGIGGYTLVIPLTPDEKLAYLLNVFHCYFVDLFYPADPLGVLNTDLANWWPLLIVMFVGLYLRLFVKTLSFESNAQDARRALGIIFTLAWWLVVPILLFMATFTFSHRSMYIPAISFSALLAYPLAACMRMVRFSAVSSSSEIRASRFESLRGLSLNHVVVSLGLVVFCYLLAYSPVIRAYEQWEASSRVGREILTKLTTGIERPIVEGKVNLYNVPECLRSYQNKEPRAREVTYLSDYGIKSWLNLKGFNRKLEVVIHSRSRPWDLSGEMSVAVLKSGNKNLRAIVRMKPVLVGTEHYYW